MDSPWTCPNCNQMNANWAADCGRCGYKGHSGTVTATPADWREDVVERAIIAYLRKHGAKLDDETMIIDVSQCKYLSASIIRDYIERALNWR